MPLDVVVTDSRYYSTSRNSGLAQIDSITRNPSDGTKDTHTSEFNVQCGAYVVKIGVVSFTDGEQDVLKKPIQHPELTDALCVDKRVIQELQDDPSQFAGYLLPLARIP